MEQQNEHVAEIIRRIAADTYDLNELIEIKKAIDDAFARMQKESRLVIGGEAIITGMSGQYAAWNGVRVRVSKPGRTMVSVETPDDARLPPRYRNTNVRLKKANLTPALTSTEALLMKRRAEARVAAAETETDFMSELGGVR